MPSSETIAREFDAKAAVYESNRLAGWYIAHADHLFERLALRPGDVVLDIGCGTGYLLRKIARESSGVTGIGIDLSPRMVDEAGRLAAAAGLRDLVFLQVDWERPSRELEHMLAIRAPNCVVCANAFHYFADPQGALARMHAVLSPRGTLWLFERAKEASPLTVAWEYAHRYVIRDHVRFYDSHSLLAMMATSGFRQTRIRSRLRRYFWRGKSYTSLVLLSGTKL